MTQPSNPSNIKPPGDRQKTVRRWMFFLVLACQAATIAISWPVWQVRERPVNLPMTELPAISFGIVALVSLAAAAFFPRPGVALHAAVMALACVFDQNRMQPQFLSLLVLMWGCVSTTGALLTRWYLAAMWLWAGLHKFLSPEWFGCLSWEFLKDAGIDPEEHVAFAVIAASVEVGLGLAAIFAPRKAAIGCLLFHLGVVVSLSPVFGDHNASVWPWNVATAFAGAWLLRLPLSPASPIWRFAAAALFILPAGYYAGWVNVHFAFVLYSGQLPHALHVSEREPIRLDGWTGMTVPFPDSPRLFREAFRRTAKAGDKLHIYDPRRSDPNRYYLLKDGRVKEITRRRFHEGDIPGIELESRNDTWKLVRAGTKIERDELGLADSITIDGPRGDDALHSLIGLPNLRTVKMNDVKLEAASLHFVGELPRLEILEFNNVSLPPASLAELTKADSLRWLHIEGTPLTIGSLSVLQKLPQLEVLHLPRTGINDDAMRLLGALPNLIWVNVSDNPLTDRALEPISKLSKCEWLVLSRTRISDDAVPLLEKLHGCKNLELSGTQITDNGLTRLRSALPDCQIVK